LTVSAIAPHGWLVTQTPLLPRVIALPPSTASVAGRVFYVADSLRPVKGYPWGHA
jgi:hypothetical protein